MEEGGRGDNDDGMALMMLMILIILVDVVKAHIFLQGICLTKEKNVHILSQCVDGSCSDYSPDLQISNE